MKYEGSLWIKASPTTESFLTMQCYNLQEQQHSQLLLKKYQQSHFTSLIWLTTIIFPERIQTHSILTDVIGVLTSAHPVEKSFFNNRITQRKTVNIQNIRSDSLQVTLWETLANDFDEEIDKLATGTTIIIFAGMLVKQYLGKPYVASTSATVYFVDPSLPETQTLKTRFANKMKKYELLPATKAVESIEQLKTKNRMKIRELKNVDPSGQYTVTATITNFDTTQGWYYDACLTCKKMVKPSGTTWWCDVHTYLQRLPVPWYKLNTQIKDDSGETKVTFFGQTAQILIQKSCGMITIDEGYTDQTVTPPAIERLKGQRKIFQVYFKTYRGSTSIIVSKVFEDELLDTTELPLSATPTPIQKIPASRQRSQSPETETTSSIKRKLPRSIFISYKK